ncbi:MAG: BCCT family transporter [Desulfobacterales bacterium]|nr:BCCT family transporter [Desulfobacterales bacterium]
MESNLAKLDKKIFWPTFIILVIVSIPCCLLPDKSAEIAGTVLSFLTHQLGWLFLWFTAGACVTLGWLAFGKYGNVRMGGPDVRPDFSTFTWFAMLFCASFGSGLLYWSACEWGYHFQSPAWHGIAPKSKEAGEWAVTYAMYHWGFVAWVIYCIPTLPIAYAFYNRKIPFLRLSSACSGVIGEHQHSLLGKVIDMCFMFGLIGGTAAAFGLGTPMLSEGVSRLTGIPKGFGMDVAILGFMTILFSISVWRGLEKGIATLSNINMYFLVGLLVFVLLAGPTVYLISQFTDSLGLIVQNVAHMSLYTDPIQNGGFPQGWTIFYWGWYVALAPFVGLFTARVSKGRTIREIVVAVVIVGGLGCMAYMAVMGGTAMYFDMNNIVPFTDIMANDGAPAAIISFVQQLPMGNLLVAIWVLCAFICLATNVDSTAYSLAIVASTNVKENQDPPRWHRMVWAFALTIVGIALLAMGGLKPIQTICVVTALPLLIVISLSVVSFMRWLKEDYGELEKELRPVNEYDNGTLKKAS